MTARIPGEERKRSKRLADGRRVAYTERLHSVRDGMVPHFTGLGEGTIFSLRTRKGLWTHLGALAKGQTLNVMGDGALENLFTMNVKNFPKV